MPIASDGKGNFLTLDQNQQWVPARTATNQAGDTLVLDGGEWKPAAAGASTTGAQPSAAAPAPAHDSMWPQPPGTKPAAAPSPTPPSAAQPQRYDPSGYPIAPPDQTKPAIPPTLTDPSTWPLPQDPAALRIRQATIDAFQNAPSMGERPGNMSVLTPEAQQAVNTTFGWSGRNIINPLATGLGYGIGALAAAPALASATVGELANAAGQPALGRDINIGAQIAPVVVAGIKATSPGGIPSDPRVAVNSRRYVPPLEAPGPRYVPTTAVTPEGLTMADARQAVRNALMPTADEIAPPSNPPGFRANVDPTKPFTYNPPSAGWPAGTDRWAAPSTPAPSSPTGVAGPMQPPEGYVPPRPPAPAGTTPPFTGTPKTSAEAKQAATQFYQANAASAGKAMPPEFTNAYIDDLNAAAAIGPMEKATAGETPIGRIAADMQKLRDTPTTLEDAQRTYSRLGDAATEEFRKNGNSENYSQLMQIQSNMRDRISPPDLAGNDPWTLARKAWSQAMKMHDLEQMKARADGTKNPQTSYQTQINNYTNNPARVRGWTDDEIQAAKDSATLGYIGNAIHLLGSRAIPIVAGAIEMRHGPVSSALAAGATYTLGTGARAAEDWMTTRRYNAALQLLGQGVPRNQLMQ